MSSERICRECGCTDNDCTAVPVVCPQCDGKTRVPCSRMEGPAADHPPDCEECGGDLDNSCPRCGGRGTVCQVLIPGAIQGPGQGEPEQCVLCGSEEIYWRRVNTGEGVFYAWVCDECGTAHEEQDHVEARARVDCRNCGGDGYLRTEAGPCPACGGEGVE